MEGQRAGSEATPKFRGANTRSKRSGQFTITLFNSDAVFVRLRAAELGIKVGELFRAMLHQAIGAKLPIVVTPETKQ